MPTPLVDSTLLKAMPSVGSAVILTPSSYANWPACFAANSSLDDFRLTPGNYLPWGNVEIAPGTCAPGTALRNRTIRYHNPDDEHLHPLLRSNEARVRLVVVREYLGAPVHWSIIGLTVRDHSSAEGGAQNSVRESSPYVTFHECHMQGVWGLEQFVTNSSHTRFQRCTVIDPEFPTGGVGDNIGFYFKCPTGDSVIGCYLLDSETRNCGDGFQNNFSTGGEADDIQITADGFEAWVNALTTDYTANTSRAENGADLKAGSSTLQSVLKNSRFWGFRKTDTSSGEGLNISNQCRNWLIEDVIVGDCEVGFDEGYWAAEANRDIVLRRVQFHDVRRYNAASNQGCLLLQSNTRVEDCHVARSDYFTGQIPLSGYIGTFPTLSGNTLCEVGAEHTPEARAGGSAYILAHPELYPEHQWPIDPTITIHATLPAGAFYDLYQRRRFTGPEWAVGARLATSRFLRAPAAKSRMRARAVQRIVGVTG